MVSQQHCALGKEEKYREAFDSGPGAEVMSAGSLLHPQIMGGHWHLSHTSFITAVGQLAPVII